MHAGCQPPWQARVPWDDEGGCMRPHLCVGLNPRGARRAGPVVDAPAEVADWPSPAPPSHRQVTASMPAAFISVAIMHVHAGNTALSGCRGGGSSGLGSRHARGHAPSNPTRPSSKKH